MCSISLVAQEPSKVDIFGGYQYLHANSGVSGVDGLNFNGWNAAVSGYFTRNFGVTADFSGNYAKPKVLGVSVGREVLHVPFRTCGASSRMLRTSHHSGTHCLAAGICPRERSA